MPKIQEFKFVLMLRSSRRLTMRRLQIAQAVHDFILVCKINMLGTANSIGSDRPIYRSVAVLVA